MTSDWTRRAFPTLPAKDARELAVGLGESDYSDLKCITEVAVKLEKGEPPLRRQRDESDDQAFTRRFVFGKDPIPNLADAEKIRVELQQTLSDWVLQMARIQSTVAENLMAESNLQMKAQRKRCLLWHLAGSTKDGIRRPGVAKHLADLLAKDPPPKDLKMDDRWQHKQLALVIKLVRKDLDAGLPPYTLPLREAEKIETWTSFSKLG